MEKITTTTSTSGLHPLALFTHYYFYSPPIYTSITTNPKHIFFFLLLLFSHTQKHTHTPFSSSTIIYFSLSSISYAIIIIIFISLGFLLFFSILRRSTSHLNWIINQHCFTYILSASVGFHVVLTVG